ncbi:MAG: TolC family protein [Alphaproteobacteria bacterium]|nr:TolC family protein [Alphaproteobacteria bacterium]
MPKISPPLSGIVFFLLLSGCASYKPLPLARDPNLAQSLAGLKTELPSESAKQNPRKIDIGKPLSIDDVGLIAVLNDPDIRSEQGEMGVANADLVQASLLPNPSVSLGYAALLGGPGTTAAYAASLSQDVASLVTYGARNEAAKTHVGEVNADLLWKEWQVAQKARLLALDIYWGEQSIALNKHQLDLLSDEITKVQKAVAADNLDLKDLSPLLASKASAEQSLATLNLDTLKNWQELDALLGLVPDARFSIAVPEPFQIPADTESLVAGLPERRPDLVALQLGYQSSDEDVRAAILGQFPAFALGGQWGSDTSAVRSAGPTVTFELPIFNRNQGQIAKARATRAMLHEQYQARLDSAAGDVRGLMAQMERLSADLAHARKAADAAKAEAATAKAAYAQGNIDQRALTDYETTALQRETEVISLEKSLGEDRIMFTIELGLGLPMTRIVPAVQEVAS